MAINKVELCGVNTSRLPVLNAEEKETLLKKAREGDAAARERYIQGNLRLVLSVIKRFSNSSENADDLFQIGCIGLIKAIDNFDTTLNVRFSTYAVPMIRTLLDHDLPIFGICLGHQMLALALGAKTVKMGHGHHGANHPVRDIDTGKVEITSMNHGFAVDAQTLPEGVRETHVSLFDGSNCGLAVDGRPVFSVQYHPEASPGPQDSAYLFDRFAEQMRNRRAG